MVQLGFPDMDRAAGETGVTKSLINETDVIVNLISFENIRFILLPTYSN